MVASPPVQHQARTPLIAGPWRPVALVAVGVALAGLVALSVALHDTPKGTGFDNHVLAWLVAHTGPRMQQSLFGLSDPTLVVSLIGLVVVVAALARRWRLVAVATMGPIVAGVMTEMVLKPLVNRVFGLIAVTKHGAVTPGVAFPSGHETGLASLTTVLLVLVGHAPVGLRVRVAGAAVLIVWTVAGAIDLVRGYFHYATDTVGGMCVSVVCVLGVALLVDVLAPMIDERRRQLT